MGNLKLPLSELRYRCNCEACNKIRRDLNWFRKLDFSKGMFGYGDGGGSMKCFNAIMDKCKEKSQERVRQTSDMLRMGLKEYNNYRRECIIDFMKMYLGWCYGNDFNQPYADYMQDNDCSL